MSGELISFFEHPNMLFGWLSSDWIIFYQLVWREARKHAVLHAVHTGRPNYSSTVSGKTNKKKQPKCRIPPTLLVGSMFSRIIISKYFYDSIFFSLVFLVNQKGKFFLFIFNCSFNFFSFCYCRLWCWVVARPHAKFDTHIWYVTLRN